jgi:hypothetical protein
MKNGEKPFGNRCWDKMRDAFLQGSADRLSAVSQVGNLPWRFDKTARCRLPVGATSPTPLATLNEGIKGTMRVRKFGLAESCCNV